MDILPNEIMQNIGRYLTLKDMKNLCKIINRCYWLIDDKKTQQNKMKYNKIVVNINDMSNLFKKFNLASLGYGLNDFHNL